MIAEGCGSPANTFLDDSVCGFFGFGGQDVFEGEECGDEMNVGLDGLEEFGFEKHLLEVEALEGVFLHELDDGGGEILAEIAEPAGDVGTGGAEAALLT
jgi:hypothetical protein